LTNSDAMYAPLFVVSIFPYVLNKLSIFESKDLLPRFIRM
jgi:hypothetical protein